jgi:hypothetical protein
MNTSQATISNDPTTSAPLFDNPIAARALEWAREWYPEGEYAVLARQLRHDRRRFRSWPRSRWRDGHSILKSHRLNDCGVHA